MDNNNNGGKCACSTMCPCGTGKCGMNVQGCNYKHKILKKLLLLIVFIIIFDLGMKIGELKGMLSMQMYNNHEAAHMMYANGGMNPMMGGDQGGMVNQ